MILVNSSVNVPALDIPGSTFRVRTQVEAAENAKVNVIRDIMKRSAVEDGVIIGNFFEKGAAGYVLRRHLTMFLEVQILIWALEAGIV